jgi:Protein of unknown function (DUF1569)
MNMERNLSRDGNGACRGRKPCRIIGSASFRSRLGKTPSDLSAPRVRYTIVLMKTIWDAGSRQQILARFEKLTPDLRPAWGSMTSAQVLAHLADPMKAAMGQKAVVPKPGAFSNPIVRSLIIYCLPWPKGAPTAPEFIHAHEEPFEYNLSALRATLEEFVASGESTRREPHPAFGQLSGRAWGRLMYRHLNHHLRQFGI